MYTLFIYTHNKYTLQITSRVPKNTYPMCALSMHVSSDCCTSADSQSSCWSSVLQCTCQLALAASLAQRVWCAVKAQKKIFRGQGGLRVLFGKAWILRTPHTDGWSAYYTRRYDGGLEYTCCTKSTNLSQLIASIGTIALCAYYTLGFVV